MGTSDIRITRGGGRGNPGLVLRRILPAPRVCQNPPVSAALSQIPKAGEAVGAHMTTLTGSVGPVSGPGEADGAKPRDQAEMVLIGRRHQRYRPFDILDLDVLQPACQEAALCHSGRGRAERGLDGAPARFSRIASIRCSCSDRVVWCSVPVMHRPCRGQAWLSLILCRRTILGGGRLIWSSSTGRA